MAEITVKVDDNSIIEIGQVPATNINVDISTPPIINTSIVGVGPRGRRGEDGIGIPAGGAKGQIMVKNSGQDYDIAWINFNPDQVHFNTTAEWEDQPALIGELGHIYVYTDYQIINNKSVPGIKIGDGTTLLSALAFISGGPGEGSVAPGGNAGDLYMKRSGINYDAEWVAPATSVEQDNTRPITAAAVYTEIGNINALLATI